MSNRLVYLEAVTDLGVLDCLSSIEVSLEPELDGSEVEVEAGTHRLNETFLQAPVPEKDQYLWGLFSYYTRINHEILKVNKVTSKP